MNFRIIFSISLIFVLGFIKVDLINKDFDSLSIPTCPETRETDILYVHGFMQKVSLDSKMKGKFKTSSLFESDKKKFDSYLKEGKNTLKLFKDYWKQNGVEQVNNNSQVCEKIFSALKKKELYSIEKNINVREIIYRVQDKYVILFVPDEVRGTGSRIYPKPVVLDMELNVIEN